MVIFAFCRPAYMKDQSRQSDGSEPTKIRIRAAPEMAKNRLYMRVIATSRHRTNNLYKRLFIKRTLPALKPERVALSDLSLSDLCLRPEILKCPSPCLRQVTDSDLRFRALEGYEYPQTLEAPAIMAFTFKGERRGDHSLKAQELRTVPAPPLKGGGRPQSVSSGRCTR